MPSGCAGSRSAASPRSTPSASAEASAGEGSSSSWSVPRIAWLPTMVTVVTPAMGAAARATCRASSRRTCILQQGPSGVLVKDCLRLMVAERVGEPRGHRPCGTGVQLEAERLEPVLERVAARDLVTGFVAGQGCSVHAGGCSGMEVFRWMSASIRRRGAPTRSASTGAGSHVTGRRPAGRRRPGPRVRRRHRVRRRGRPPATGRTQRRARPPDRWPAPRPRRR